MKIALPTKDGMIDGHFGHCEYFTVYTVEDNIITGEERLDPPAGAAASRMSFPQWRRWEFR